MPFPRFSVQNVYTKGIAQGKVQKVGQIVDVFSKFCEIIGFVTFKG